MDILSYILVCVPGVLLIVVGVVMSLAKKDAILSNHHFAKRVDIDKYTRKIISLFTIAGIMLALGGILLINERLLSGFLVLIITLLVFIISFASLNKNN